MALIAYVDTLADQGPLIDLPPEHLEDLAEHWSNVLELDITGIEDELRAGHVIPIT